LDHILRGGLPENRLYLVSGTPGSGKTTLALQYLLQGVAQGETAMYITLSETKEEIEAVAKSHSWHLDKITIFELSALEEQLKQESQNTIFHVSEVELNKTTEALLDKIERARPRRLVVDSLSELRLLAESALRYRRQMLSLKQYFSGRNMTVLVLDDHAGAASDLHVQSIAHGVLMLDQVATDYGAKRRRMEVQKLRGVDFVGGFHDATIVHGGLRVFPRLIAAEHERPFDHAPVSSGNTELNALLGGGLDRGSSCLLLGPAGSGKSTVAMQFAAAAAQRGERVFYFLFDEGIRTMVRRGESLGMPLQRFIDEGLIVPRQIDPAELPPGEFINLVREAIEQHVGRVVVVDSLNGYLQAMPAATFLAIQLHEMQTFLARQGVVTLMTVAQHGLLGQMEAPVDVTYLADSVVLTRYFEQAGAIRKAISVIKKRGGQHESTIRELAFHPRGLELGQPLTEFHGVLTGVPVYTGADVKMLHKK
ncbi:MAG TPA: ATPase domain-containing protein, partial [Opitutaceae bacterium]